MAQPLHLLPADLRALRPATMTVTTECAGNGRESMAPPVEGQAWGQGAVSTSQWTGAPLREVLARAGVRDSAVEILFSGADSGFARSLPMEKALDPETDREEAIVSVPAERKLRDNFGREVVADYSTTELECTAEMFPLSKALDPGTIFSWQNRYMRTGPWRSERQVRPLARLLQGRAWKFHAVLSRREEAEATAAARVCSGLDQTRAARSAARR